MSELNLLWKRQVQNHPLVSFAIKIQLNRITFGVFVILLYNLGLFIEGLEEDKESFILLSISVSSAAIFWFWKRGRRSNHFNRNEKNALFVWMTFKILSVFILILLSFLIFNRFGIVISLLFIIVWLPGLEFILDSPRSHLSICAVRFIAFIAMFSVLIY